MNFGFLTPENVEYFILVFVRISSMIAFVPIFGAQSVPVQIRVALSLFLSVIFFSTLSFTNVPLHIQQGNASLFLACIKEILIGLTISFVASFLFTAVQFAARLVDTEMGFGFAELVDPFSDESITTLGQLQVIIFTIIFLLLNGHYFLILAIQKSYQLIPIGTLHFREGPIAWHLTTMLSDVFVLAIKFAAPMYVTLLLSELALGLVARTVPQMNIFFVGIPVKIVLGLGCAIIALPMLANLFKVMVDGLVQDIWRVLFLMAGN